MGDEWDCVDLVTGKLTSNACFASGWYMSPLLEHAELTDLRNAFVCTFMYL